MAADLERFGERITELRGELPRAQVARHAGITGAYLHALENATPNKGGRPTRPTVPMVRAIADALGASRVELLLLAGYDDDAIYDEIKERKAARPPAVEDRSRQELLDQMAHIAAVLAERERSQGDETPAPGSRRSPAAPPGTPRTGTRGTKRRA